MRINQLRCQSVLVQPDCSNQFSSDGEGEGEIAVAGSCVESNLTTYLERRGGDGSYASMWALPSALVRYAAVLMHCCNLLHRPAGLTQRCLNFLPTAHGFSHTCTLSTPYMYCTYSTFMYRHGTTRTEFAFSFSPFPSCRRLLLLTDPYICMYTEGTECPICPIYCLSVADAIRDD